MATIRRWPSDAEREALYTMTNREISRRFGVSDHTIRKWRRHYMIPSPAPNGRAGQPVEGPAPAPWGAPEPPGPLAEESGSIIDLSAYRKGSLVDSLIAWQRAVAQTDPRVEEATVEIPGDEPVLVAFTSDWHVGHRNCDLALLRRDLALAGKTPGVYLIAGGDLINGTVTSVAVRGMGFEELAPGVIQTMIVNELCDLVPDERWLAICLGNHEGWSRRDVDHDPMAALASRVRAAYFGPWGFLNVRLGTQEYRILAGHKFRMSSTFNKTHMAKRAMDFLGDADVVFFGDKHDYAAEETRVRRQDRFFFQAGTYQRENRYGLGLGFPSAAARMPGVVLFPDEKLVVGTPDAFNHGLHQLASYRSDLDLAEYDYRLLRRGEGAAAA